MKMDDSHEVVIAMGGNIGDRVANIERGIVLMRDAGIHIHSHARLYESAPAYYFDQPHFLNTAIQARTSLNPESLLKTLKEIELQLGRDLSGSALRNGPRPLDLDIIFYGTLSVDTPSLQIPHPRLAERSFVVAPLVDLLPGGKDAANHWSTHPRLPSGISKIWTQMADRVGPGKDLECVIPIGSSVWRWQDDVHIMGILNATPDSFSDGGRYLKPEKALQHAKDMVDKGAKIIDVGGQSTRPGAEPLSISEEISRTIPVVEMLSSDPHFKECFISVDTFNADVAVAAVQAGAHIVNDVSAGTLDATMGLAVAGLRVPYVMMHMRGTPQTMTSAENTKYANVCKDVGAELASRTVALEAGGLPAWRMIVDPGLGFAKTEEGNFQLLRNLPSVRDSLVDSRNGAVGHAPLLVGPSRKSFLGKVIGRQLAPDRDWATCAATVACVIGGANIVRAHNVAAVRDAIRVSKKLWWK